MQEDQKGIEGVSAQPTCVSLSGRERREMRRSGGALGFVQKYELAGDSIVRL